MRIYQIILGQLPEYLRACVESVKSFSIKVGADYIQITEIPEGLKAVPDTLTAYERNRTIKDWVSLKLLSEQERVLIVDWDVYLYDAFGFNGNSKYPIFASGPVDCMMYNGGSTAAFSRILELAGDPREVQPGALLTANAIRLFKDERRTFKHFEFNKETYKHLDNCRLTL